MEKILDKVRNEAAPVLAFIFAFTLVFSCVFLMVTRTIAIKKVRYEIAQMTTYLNEFDLDISYDKIEFNTMFFSPLMRVEGLQLYNTRDLNSWAVKLNEVKAYHNLFGDSRVRFDLSNGGEFTFNDFSTRMELEKGLIELTAKNDKIDELIFHAENIDIHSLAKIQKTAFLLQHVEGNFENKAVSVPSYESFFEMNDVEINGLIDYPLSPKLKLIYAKTALMGKIVPDGQLTAGVESWIKDGGFIDVQNLIVQWKPLTMVGRGNITFNKDFEANMTFNTSSKGLLRLLDDLKKNEFLDNKNVFVANILLSNKAFKLNPEDKELTISTPISYSKGKVSIENMVIKDFETEIPQSKL